MTFLVKFFFLAVFPALLSPAAYVESAQGLQRTEFLATKSHIIVAAETHSSSCTVVSMETELTESEMPVHAPVPLTKTIGLILPTVISTAPSFSENILCLTPLLAYLSLFSISPPRLS